jgi:hypothetical protein
MLFVLCIPQAAIAAAILAIVAMQLLNVEVKPDISTQKQALKTQYSCLMTDDTSNPAVCNYALVAASFSLIATAAVSILQVRPDLLLPCCVCACFKLKPHE